MIEALVKFNDGIAFVMQQKPEFTYYREGNTIIGLDSTCTFVHCYEYDRPSPGFYAFGGREFDIQLDGGEIIHCYGQWWDGGYQKAAELLGEELVHATYNDIPGLKSCYVYYGCSAVKSSIERLKNNYKSEIHEYRDYEKIIKDMKMKEAGDDLSA